MRSIFKAGLKVTGLMAARGTRVKRETALTLPDSIGLLVEGELSQYKWLRLARQLSTEAM